MFTTLSVGEVLWDLFPDYKKPGGSPANVAYHLHCLGSKSLLLSKVGQDTNGKELLQFLSEKEVDTTLIQKDQSHPTGMVHVEFNDGEPSYIIENPSAWDFIELKDLLIDIVKSMDAICFATLSQRNEVSKNSMQTILSSVSTNCLKVFDLNLRPPFVQKDLVLQSIEQADIIKINEHEYKTLSDWYNNRKFVENILEKNPAKTILLTKGEKGSSMFNKEGYFREKAHPITGSGDFVGVGDAFLACFTYLKLKDTHSSKILSLANKYAAFVASQKGGMPDIPQSVLDEIQ